MRKIRILLNAGGTGGHIYPLLAVAETLRARAASGGPEIDLRYFGNPGEYDLNLKSLGIKVSRVASSKMRRYFSILNFIDFFKFLWSIPQALWKIFWFMPDVAFSKGGPGALAVLYACRFYRIPVIIHESDAIPSLTTKKIAKFAKLIELSFESALPYVGRENAKVVGNPVREELILEGKDFAADAKVAAKRKLNLDESLPLILILGGSQGALVINDFALVAAPELVKNSQIIHQVGIVHYSLFMNTMKKLSANWSKEALARYHPVPFLQRDLRTTLIAADLVVTRAGAGAIFEIAAGGTPSVLIPLQNSANDHQNENAYQYRTAGACEVIREENLETTIATNIIKSLLGDPARLQKMSENAKKFSKPEAADIIAADIINLANK